MPPAFVLSQNQTLKFMTDNHPGGITEEEAGISGSRSCTIYMVCILGHWNGLVCPIFDAQRPSNTGAAAHMSLHQTDNEKEPTPHQPRFYRGTGIPIW